MKANVIEAGQEMLEKIKLMSLDPEAYYLWVQKNENVSVDYSESEKSLSSLYEKDGQNRRLYELYVMGDKMTQAMMMAENLRIWSDEGLAYSGLANVHSDIKCLATVLLQEMESVLDGLSEDVFSEDYGEGNFMERQTHTIATDLSSACDNLRMFLAVKECAAKQDNE